MILPGFFIRRPSAVLAIAVMALTACGGGHSAASGNSSVLPASLTTGTVRPMAYEQGSGGYTVFPEPAYDPQWLSVGSDNGIYFASDQWARILRITNSGGITTYPLAAALAPNCFPNGLTDAVYKSDSARVWFDAPCMNGSGGVAPGFVGLVSNTGTVVAAALGNDSSGNLRDPFGYVVEGPTGTLWFAEDLVSSTGSYQPAIGEIRNAASALSAAQSSGSLASVVQDITTANDPVVALAIGPDKNLWFVTSNYGGVGTPVLGTISGAGTVTSYPVQGIGAGGLLSYGGYLYATGASELVAAKPIKNAAPAITTYPLPSSSFDYAIAPGSDGNIYFTGFDGNANQWTVFEFDPLTKAFSSNLGPAMALEYGNGLALGPDGNIWGAGDESADIFVLQLHSLIIGGLGSPPSATLSLHEAPNAPFTVTEPDPGGTAITVTSSDTTVVTVSPSGSQTNTGAPLTYTLTPVGAGDAVIKVVDQKNNFVHIPVSVNP